MACKSEHATRLWRQVPKFVLHSVSVLLQELIRLPSIVNLGVFLRKFSDNYFQLGLREKQRKTTTSY